MREDIEFFYAILPRPDGSAFVTVVGVGADRSLWVEATSFGVGLAELEKLERDVGAVILHDTVDGRVYVEARAVVANCKTPELEKELAAGVEAWLDHLHPKNFRT